MTDTRVVPRRVIALMALAAMATFTALSASGQSRVPAASATPGFSSGGLARIDTALLRYVDDGKVAGVVALVLRDGAPVYRAAFGWADKEAGRRMTDDAMFRIASQTKALTSAAIMMLVDEGKVGITDPVSRFIPAYAKTFIAVNTDTGRAIIPAARAITIRHLLTHTAGISYGTDRLVAPLYEAKGLGPAAGAGWYTADKVEPVCTTMERLATLPFVAQPGEAYVYGYATDILGCVVERASGMSLEEFIRTRITAPLGMRDTHFFVPAEKRARLTAVYSSAGDGLAARAPDGARGQGHYVDGPRVSYSGGAGLVSTAADYARFLEMIRHGGTIGGRRYLSPPAAALMHTNMVGTLRGTDGLGYGLGFETVDRFGASGYRAAGSYGWGGAYGSWYGVDPKERLVLVLMIQLVPNGSDIRDRFPTLVYQALEPSKP